MTKRMLIDATHAEETRVAVVDGHKLIDFDYESKLRKQLKGSIFLAKVTRVEPSLQAAFVNFGGNRHGFLPFAEIHPDYFRIPIADREALIAEQQAEMEARRAAEEAEFAEEEARAKAGEQPALSGEDESEDEVIEEIGGGNAPAPEKSETTSDVVEDNAAPQDNQDTDEDRAEAAFDATSDEDFAPRSSDDEASESDEAQGETESGEQSEQNTAEQGGAGDGEQGESQDGSGERPHRRGGRSGGRWRGNGRGGRQGGGDHRRMGADARRVELIGGDEVEGDHPIRPSLRRKYKIQEVIKRGQIMLVQVSKEERGNKGAAVSTYLSLPGRYCVLMPNSPRGGGVSRKVDHQDRRRMRELLSELEVPQGMSVILRTAGVSRTKAEIKRDLDYLMRLWNDIRELTLKSTAPAQIHEEGNLIRRSIRDIYGKNVEDIHVAGEEGYKVARDFMKLLIPSHIKKVSHYEDRDMPLFQRYQVESQIAAMSEPTVTLKSGGYLVINPTEALVSIDVNSGRATRERHIEETALRTNMEAAEEVARQLRLRDLGGLVVIDFIDMEDRRNNRKVEQKLRDALSVDRARIQMGRISTFGLMELSRQRMNPSLTEAQFERCPHCKGIGFIRSVDSAAILALRALEEEGTKHRANEVILHVPNKVALYILNSKREMLGSIEKRYEFNVLINVDDSLAPAGFRVEGSRRVAVSDDDEDDGDSRRPTSAVRSADRGGEPEASGDESTTEPAHNHSRSHAQEPREGGRERNFNREGGREGGRDGAARRRGGRNRGGRSGERGDFRRDGEQPRQNAPVGNREEIIVDVPDDIGNRRDPNEDRWNDDVQPQANVVASGDSQNPRRRGRKPAPYRRDRNPSDQGQGQQNGGQGYEPNGNVSNDVAMTPPPAPKPAMAASAPPSPPPPRDYEVVNAPSDEKKKGWWNKLME